MTEIQNDTLVVSFPEMEAALRARLDAWLSGKLSQLAKTRTDIDLPKLRCRLESKVHVRATLSFQRTLRLPDNGRTYNLPAGLGRMELEHIDDLRNVSTEAKARGGVALPMYSGEAMWIRFEAEYPMALRIACGKTCAVSGLPWSSGLQENPQNYVVIPKQPWLDGFRINTDTIRQFVAEPLGSGKTVENFLTGEEHWGGIQIQALPMNMEAGFDWLVENELNQVFSEFLHPIETPRCISICRVPLECPLESMGLGAGARILQQVDRDPWGVKNWETKISSRVFIHILHAGDWSFASGKPMPRLPLSMEDYQNGGIPWFDYDSQEQPVVGRTLLSGLENRGTASSSPFTPTPGTRPVREMDAEEAQVSKYTKQTSIAPVHARRPNMYWITVGSEVQNNFAKGIQAGLWGVKQEYNDRIRHVQAGDLVLFYGKQIGCALCTLESNYFLNTEKVWPDATYPHRVKISGPLLHAKDAKFSNVWVHLKDRAGKPFSSIAAAARAIGGAGGVFRPLREEEISALMKELGWTLTRIGCIE